MKIINYPILHCINQKEFRSVFDAEFVDKELKFEGYNLKIIKDDFNHIFFERGAKGKEKAKFGIRRARRMMFVKAICEKDIPYILLWETNRPEKEVCVLCEEAEVAVYLKARKTKKENFLILKTLIVFGSQVISRIDKQKKQSRRIKNLKLVFEEAD
jgi:hypothetical protein